MNMDTLVFDVETSNFFSDPGVGWNNYDALKTSVVGVYSYAQDKYFCFDEHELDQLAELMRNAELLVGFSINRYDVPVLNVAFREKGINLNLFQKERVDLLDEIELVTGARISLNRLAMANLGAGKLGEGKHAAELYHQGKIEELKTYCLKDVELTKQLYDLYRTQKFLLVSDKETGEVRKIEFAKPQNLFQSETAAV